MSVPVTAEWCGACGSETTERTCPTCTLPVWGADAEELRTCSQSYRVALTHGDTVTAEVVRARHARVRARLAASTAAEPPSSPAEAHGVDEARTSASTLITWMGAALVLAGALAFATVVWQYAGGPGRIAILGIVTVAALLGADRLRWVAPTTAEASVAIAGGMCVVDAVAAHVAGYVRIDPAGWAAITLLPTGITFLALARRWRSRTAGACGIGLVALGTTGLALWPLTWTAPHSVGVLTTLAAGLATAALGLVADSVRPRAERLAVVVAASTMWVVQLAVTLGIVGLEILFGSRPLDGWAVAQSLAVASFLALPLVVTMRSSAAGLVSGLAGAGVLVTSVTLALVTIDGLDAPATRTQSAAVGCLLLLALVPTALARWSTRVGADPAATVRGAAFAAASAPFYLALGGLDVHLVQQRSGDPRAALVLAVLTVALALPAVLLEGRVRPWMTDLCATAAIAGPIAALGLVTPTWLSVPAGDVVAAVAVVAMTASWIVPSRTWRTGARWASLVAVVLAPFAGLTVIENASLAAALVAGGFGLRLWRNGERSSWVVEAPVAALLLAPTLAAALLGDRTGLRLGAVVVAGAAVLLDSARRHRQGPAVVSVAAVSTAIAWVTLPHLSETPPWLALVASGVALLWVGFTWERRRATARHLAQSWSTWE